MGFQKTAKGLYWKHDPASSKLGGQNLDENFDMADLMAPPSGMVAMYAGLVAPAGWLLCDGAAVSRVTYVGLFTAIGEAFGPGDGSTTFNLPNFTGRFPAMPGGAGVLGVFAATGGSETGSGSIGMSGLADTNGDGTTTPIPVGSDIVVQIATVPPFLTINFMIKT